ncbi:bifunctional 4-hydroxy-2-oxoglutarate aldolase/2-dehydro-3-deoxy-phosphogluconate aldolase [Streptomyces sp. NPDC088116]|uniref:bifunctional 4-hydroxy-2-oxoglutarate aldolase/2-dehydro-3-deoxy-phosphogluconate aldolase n=1 Tax=Streptomyces sp. NPDC088116 TaxID=3365825 RepID=UPI00380ABD50
MPADTSSPTPPALDQLREHAEVVRIPGGHELSEAVGFSREVAEASLAAGLPHLPGVATASEIQQAEALGFGWLKAFPAADLGPGLIASMHGPFPQARFVATGGMNLANTMEFLGAGAAAVSLGSALADPGQFAQLPRLIEAIAGQADR